MDMSWIINRIFFSIQILLASSITAVTIKDFSELCIRGNTYWLSLNQTNNTLAKEACSDIGAELTFFSTNEEYFNVSSFLEIYVRNFSLNIEGIWVDLIANDTNQDGIYEHFWRDESFAIGVWNSKEPNSVCKRVHEDECCARIDWYNQKFEGLRDKTCNIDNFNFLCSAVAGAGGIHRDNCSCETGFQSAVETIHCQDVDECLANPCQHVCTNANGSFICSCHPGYRLKGDNSTCSDVDECLETGAQCQQLCANTAGSYACSCNSGFNLSQDGFSCLDIDECVTSQYSCQQLCQNTVGNYTCWCVEGYTLAADGVSCDDVDECVLGPTTCQHSCTNTEGSYFCSCTPGFVLGQDNSSCVNITEQSYPLNANCVWHCLDNRLNRTDPEAVKVAADRIKTELMLEKQSLSSYKRSKISIQDSRPSFQAIGYFGISFLVLVLGFIIVPDIISAFRFVTKMN